MLLLELSKDADLKVTTENSPLVEQRKPESEGSRVSPNSCSHRECRQRILFCWSSWDRGSTTRLHHAGDTAGISAWP